MSKIRRSTETAKKRIPRQRAWLAYPGFHAGERGRWCGRRWKQQVVARARSLGQL